MSRGVGALAPMFASLGEPISYVESALASSFLAVAADEIVWRCQIEDGEVVLLRSHLLLRVRTCHGWPLGIDVWMPSDALAQILRNALWV